MKLQILVDVFDNLMKSGIDRNGIAQERSLINLLVSVCVFRKVKQCS